VELGPATPARSGPLNVRRYPGTHRMHTVYETSSLIIGSTSITAYAEGDSMRLWTCAVSAAVFRTSDFPSVSI
jgi:hypothetical protein